MRKSYEFQKAILEYSCSILKVDQDTRKILDSRLFCDKFKKTNPDNINNWHSKVNNEWFLNLKGDLQYGLNLPLIMDDKSAPALENLCRLGALGKCALIINPGKFPYIREGGGNQTI